MKVVIKKDIKATSVQVLTNVNEQVKVGVRSTTSSGFDHTELANRNAANQHTIDSITGLREALSQAGKSTYTHDQMVPQKVWNITHNLDCFPSVTVIDSSGRVVIGDVTYISKNEVQVSFTAEFSGKVYLN